MLKVLRKADLVLNACGRPIPPAGFKYIDLPYSIPVKATFSPAGSPNAPFQIEVKNNALTQFICKGIIFGSTQQIRIKWPGGHFFSQNPSHVDADGSPIGAGANMLALDEPVLIESGANIAIEVTP